MSLEEIDDLERSKQVEERSNSDQSERSSTRIRVARSHPRVATRNRRKAKETDKPLLKNSKAKKLSDSREDESDLSSEDEGVDERPLEKADKGQAAAQEYESSDSDSEWTSSSDNSTTSEDSGVSDLSEQEDLMDLDEDDEVDEEKEKEIKVRRLKVEKARMSKDVIKVYSDQRIKLKPSNCTRVKVKMGKYAPAQNKLMFTPVPQVEIEVQPLAGVTDHRGKYFEIVIANHSSKYRVVKKNQLLGYVEPYEHMENVKVNAGTVKNVLEDPEVDDTTKAELTKIIGNLKLGPDLTEEQKNDVYNAFWEFWKVLPTSKKPYGDVKGSLTEMTMPEDVVTKTNIPDDYGTPDEWVETMKKNLTFAEEVARCNIKDAYEKNAEIYNKKKSEPIFKVGDLVLIRLPKDTKQGKKENQSDFKSKYDKVWKILSFPRANEAEVIEQNPKKEADLKVVSIDRLKPWHPPLPDEKLEGDHQGEMESERSPQNDLNSQRKSFFEPPLLPEKEKSEGDKPSEAEHAPKDAKAVEEKKAKQKRKKLTPTELLTQKGEVEDAADKELLDRITKGRKEN
ncbi:uncharacterized protein LOC129592756 [Paramacrobiotus metropolitanus]|uniref:uncharacterized protein LOC129592756 n=1 Tax=Paramacrobiotus metropolitanus TaxID=2943436 RepID=UPI0024460E54|nr:uncharacterized protein LOC129592756 [Paramacrobiotus metropolitanus]